MPDLKHHRPAVDIGYLQAHRLRGAQARGIGRSSVPISGVAGPLARRKMTSRPSVESSELYCAKSSDRGRSPPASPTARVTQTRAAEQSEKLGGQFWTSIPPLGVKIARRNTRLRREARSARSHGPSGRGPIAAVGSLAIFAHALLFVCGANEYRSLARPREA
jgi:hypothetical protein